MQPDNASRRTAVYGGVLMLLAATVMLLPSWPALVDLPGHVAHYHLSLEGDRSELLQRYYRFHWILVPNLGGELIVFALAKLVGLDLAVRLFVAAVPALAVGGMIALARVVHGGISPLTLLALPLAFSYPLVFGFLNFCLAVALAFWAAAAWIALTRAGRTRARLAFGLVVPPVLMLAHLMGWGLFGLIAFGATLALHWREGAVRAIRTAILACLPLAWPLVVLALGRRGVASYTGGWLELNTIATWLAGVLREQWMAADLASAALLYGACLLPLALRRHFAFAPVLLVPAVLAWLSVVALPMTVFGSTYANVRIIPAALALTLLAIRPLRPLPGWAWAAAIAFLAARFTLTTAALLGADDAVRRQTGALDHITPGSRVLAFGLQPCERRWAPPRLRNIHVLATSRRDALVNGHFTEAGAHAMTIDYPPAQSWMVLGTNIVHTYRCYDRPAPAEALATAPIAAFDYLWLTNFPPALLPRRGDLKLVWQAEDSALYEVQPALSRKLPVEAPTGRGGGGVAGAGPDIEAH